MIVFSEAFHTSYQYSLATAMPDVDWFFVHGFWGKNRPKPHNVHDVQDRPLEQYDVFLSHHPEQFVQMRAALIDHGINPAKLVYVSHWGVPHPELWKNKYFGKSVEEFVKDVSQHPIVSVSHFILHDFRFYSHVINEAIPHFVPIELFEGAEWQPGGNEYINIVVAFFQHLRGAGADFWSQIDDEKVPRSIYGPMNDGKAAGELETSQDLMSLVSRSKGYLWTGEYVAMSFAPLECMACGLPMIAPDNMDWAKFFTHRESILLYKYRDFPSLYQTISEFERDENLQRRLSIAGRAVIADKFGPGPFRTRWMRVLDAAASAR